MRQKLTNKNEAWNYALLAFPLSCFGIPIYIHLANFYFNQFNIALTTIALVIFLCRCCDCIFDPFVGYLSDFLVKKNISRKTLIVIGSIPLFVSFYFIFNPFILAEKTLLIWLGVNLILLYFSLSLVVINYETLVTEISSNQTNFVASRESMQILGILLISILPSIISKKLEISYDQSLSYLWIFIAPIFAISLFFLPKIKNISKNLQKNFIFQNYQFWKLSFVYLLNSISVSIPAVTIRFYVDDYLETPELNGNFLGLYFLSAAISVFIWGKIINRIGQKKSWLIAILISVAIFIFATFISKENYQLFYLVCFLSGFAVGCDLTAPQLLLIETIKNNPNKTIYFAIFSFITKLSLAFATLIALFAISNESGGLNYQAIPLTYALLPCILKIFTAIILRKL